MRITLSPNIHAVQIPPPDLHELVDEWQLQSHGISPTAAYELAQRKELQFAIQAKAISAKESDESHLKQGLHLIQGHHPKMLVVDQPLAFGREPYPPYGFPWNDGHAGHSVGIIGLSVAKFVDQSDEHQVQTSIVDMWPQNSEDEIRELIDQVQKESKGDGISRFILNWDPNAGASQMELSGTIEILQRHCENHRIEFGVVVTAHAPQPGGVVFSMEDFVRGARLQWRRLRQCSSFERVIVQSSVVGPMGKRDVPPTSALITLAEEILQGG